jgi:putative ABC transport system permease protein
VNLLVSTRIALRALGANKLRASLTMLGMIIGVGAVIAMVAIGNGAQAAITAQIEGMGTNLLTITPGARQQAGVRQQAGADPTLTLEDAQAIAAEPGLPVAYVSPEASGFGQIIARGQNTNTRIQGVTADYEMVHNAHAGSGSFISTQDVDANSSVIVLGTNVAQTLFADADPIGQTVKVSMGQVGSNYRVVGVMESKGGSGFGNLDDQAFVPLTTLQRRLAGQRNSRGARNVNSIAVSVSSESQTKAATAAIGDLLRLRHKTAQDDFTIISQEDILATAGQITGVMTLLLGSIAGISLVVGGIGIMNIMLVSVTERTREIGIRKAVGARRSDILTQFLVESVVVSVVGGGIGLALGFGLSQLVAGVDLGGMKLTPVVTPEAVMLAVGVSAAIGVFFGAYPAWRAARLHPIEALRYE